MKRLEIAYGLRCWGDTKADECHGFRSGYRSAQDHYLKQIVELKVRLALARNRQEQSK